MFEVVDCCDVIVVNFKRYVWVDFTGQREGRGGRGEGGGERGEGRGGRGEGGGEREEGGEGVNILSLLRVADLLECFFRCFHFTQT